MAVRRCRAKWGRRRDQRGQSWFDEVPLRPANTELAAAQEVWCRKARSEEIKRLGKAETSPVTSSIAEPPAKPPAAIPAQASSATPSPTPAAPIANEQRPAMETLPPGAGIANKAEPIAPPVTEAKPAAAPSAEQAERAAERQTWMDRQHPGWSCVEWSKHTRNDYKTIKKYHDGVTTNRTKSIRADIARAEKVEFSIVPE